MNTVTSTDYGKRKREHRVFDYWGLCRVKGTAQWNDLYYSNEADTICQPLQKNSFPPTAARKKKVNDRCEAGDVRKSIPFI